MKPRRRRLRLETLETRLTPSLTLVGPEFQVNTFTTGYQWQPSVACDAAGDFVIAYTGFDTSLTTHWGVFTRRYAADGTALGGLAVVAEVPSFFSNEVSVAMNAAGNYV